MFNWNSDCRYGFGADGDSFNMSRPTVHRVQISVKPMGQRDYPLIGGSPDAHTIVERFHILAVNEDIHLSQQSGGVGYRAELLVPVAGIDDDRHLRPFDEDQFQELSHLLGLQKGFPSADGHAVDVGSGGNIVGQRLSVNIDTVFQGTAFGGDASRATPLAALRPQYITEAGPQHMAPVAAHIKYPYIAHAKFDLSPTVWL